MSDRVAVFQRARGRDDGIRAAEPAAAGSKRLAGLEARSASAAEQAGAARLNARPQVVAQRVAAGRFANRTGLPNPLKAGLEALSGTSLDDVRVQYNSGKPAQLQALAYAQGNEIHLAPGQERHLAHEAAHVVQQKQGRVRTTRQLKGMALNDDGTLEREADAMAARAMRLGASPTGTVQRRTVASHAGGPPVQRKIKRYKPAEGTATVGPVAALDALALRFSKATDDAAGAIQTSATALTVKDAKFDVNAFPHSSKERAFHFAGVMARKGAYALKAAAAGYMIEDIVTQTVTGGGIQSQYVMAGARPDFVIQATDASGTARGVVDITSAKQLAHIYRKRFSPAAFHYVAECYYDTLALGDATFSYDASSVASAHVYMIKSANSAYGSAVNQLWQTADLHTGSGDKTVKAVAADVKAILTKLKSVAEVQTSIQGQVDAEILKLNAALDKAGMEYEPMETLSAVIDSIQGKYGLPGHPHSWKDESAAATPSSGSDTKHNQ